MNQARGRILAAFGVSMLASIGLTIVYALGGNPQIEGALLGVALGGIAVGLVLFAHHMLPGGQFVEPRDVVPHATAERPGVEAAFEAGAEPIERRRIFAAAFAASLGLLGIAALFPIRSLGTGPGRALFRTEWRRGRRAVTDAGRPLRLDDLDLNSVVTVFPEGHEDAADSQTLLIRLPAGVTVPGPSNWSVSGVVAFSKVCTHAGCPVGPLPGGDPRAVLPMPPIHVLGPRGRQADVRARHPPTAPATDRAGQGRLCRRPLRLHRARGPGVLEPAR